MGSARFYSGLYLKHSKLIQQNEMIKHLVYQTYDEACSRQLVQYMGLFENMLTSTFSNPFVFLKGGTVGLQSPQDGVDDTKHRIPKEIQSRSSVEATLAKWLMDIPEDSHQIDE